MRAPELSEALSSEQRLVTGLRWVSLTRVLN